MPNKRVNFRKSKFLKKPIFPKSSNSIISSSLYSGIESAQRAIQKPGYGWFFFFNFDSY